MNLAQTIDPARLGIRKRREDITLPDILELFSEEESLKIAFIPVILADVAIRYVNQVCDICVAHRMSEYKKQTRQLKLLVKEYEKYLHEGICEDSMTQLNAQVEKYIENTGNDVMKLYFSINGELKRMHPERDEYEMHTYAYMARTIGAYIEAYERSVDEEIERRCGTHLGRITSPLISDIVRVLKEITADVPITKTDNITLAMTIIGNKLVRSEFALVD